MNLKKALKSSGETLQMGIDLALGRYPAFVYGRAVNHPRQLPPVFSLHSAEPESFEAVLQYLTVNGYSTLTCDDYEELIFTGKTPERAVMLTFDDGMGSVWTVAYPLLKKYACKAVVYLIPSKIPAQPGGQAFPNLEDVWAGRVSWESLADRDRSAYPLATWDEIRTMHASGMIDFQSHTFTHRLVDTSSKVVSYVNPADLAAFHPLEYAGFSAHSGAFSVRPALGLPIYTTASRMLSNLRCLNDPALGEACTAYVAEHGGEAFFQDSDWRLHLDRFSGQYRLEHPTPPTYESVAEQEQDIFCELEQSRLAIERELPGKNVRHLAYPWGVGSDLSVRLSQQAGYATNYWGRAQGRLVNHVGQDPFQIARIGEDFLPLLPGQGRSSLRHVLAKKLARRRLLGSPYLSH